MKFSFKNWLEQELQKEMTSCASVGGGGSFTNDVAQFARPIFATVVRRQSPPPLGEEEEHKKKKKKHKKKH